MQSSPPDPLSVPERGNDRRAHFRNRVERQGEFGKRVIAAEGDVGRDHAAIPAVRSREDRSRRKFKRSSRRDRGGTGRRAGLRILWGVVKIKDLGALNVLTLC